MRQCPKIQIGERDLELIESLARCPLTPRQLLRVTETFDRPFGDLGGLRRRLRALRKFGALKSWPYALAGDGRAPHYYKVSRTGYQLLNGERILLPRRRYFEPVKPGHHYHTFSLAEFVVRLSVSAHHRGCSVERFASENSIRLDAGPFTLYPDACFDVRRRDDRIFPFVVELDNGTERVRSRLDVESIERKLRGYDAYDAQFSAHDPKRHLVLFVTTRSERRLDHIMELASEVMRNPERTVFLGCDLTTFCENDPFADPIFRDHRGLMRTLIPRLNSDSKNGESDQQIAQSVVT